MKKKSLAMKLFTDRDFNDAVTLVAELTDKFGHREFTSIASGTEELIAKAKEFLNRK